MGFQCEECEKTFTRKDKLTYHTEHNACKIITHRCSYCQKGFTTNNSMYRHTKHTCQVKKEDDAKKDAIYDRLLRLEERDKQFDILVSENAKLKKELIKIKKTKKNVTKTTNNTNNTMNNNNNNCDMSINNGTINHITLVAYGSEDMSKIDKMELEKIFQNGYNSTLRLTEVVHFNPKFPEYHNVYIANMKDKYAMMYDGDNWTLTMKEDMINKIYNDKRYYIEENLDDFLESMTLSQTNALNRWLDTEETDEKTKTIKDRIKLLLYNSKHLPIEARKNKIMAPDDMCEYVVEFDTKYNLESNNGSDTSFQYIAKKTKTPKLAPRTGTKRKNIAKVTVNK
jgi:hypothetical protein